MKFRGKKSASSVAITVALAGVACSATDKVKTDGQTGISASALVADGTDVAAIRFDVTPVSCEDGTPAGDPLTVSAPIDPDQQIPGNLSDLQDKPLDADSSHWFADSFMVVPAGCYDVVATPTDGSGADSHDCAGAFKKGVEVVQGETTEIFLINQCACDDPGAIDAIAALNHEPTVDDVEFTDSKFACGSPTEICASASDIDHDPLELVLESEDCDVEPGGESGDGKQCWTLTCHTLGRHDLTVTAYDLLHGESGLQRIEDYLAEQGYPNESHSELEFLAYVDGVMLWPDADGDGHGDANAEAHVFCGGDDTTGFVDNHDDCDDGDAHDFPGNEEMCGDHADNDCDDEVDEDCPLDEITKLDSGLGLTSAGVGLSTRGGSLVTSGNIALAGIPAGAAVKRAVLYWMTIGSETPDTTVDLDSAPLSGTLINFGEDTCWGRQGNATIAADVTPAVAAKGNGSYLIQGFPAALNNVGDDTQGASLFVIFDDPSDSRTNLIKLSAGLGVINGSGEHMTNTFAGLNVGALQSVALHNAVADGQNFLDRLLFQGVVIDGTNAFPGANGNYWDNRVDNVTALVAPGETSLLTDINIDPGNDCLAWAVNAVSVTNYQ